MNVALIFNVKPEGNILTVFNDKYAEWDSIDTIFAVRDALAKYHNVTLIEANDKAFEKIKAVNPDIVFNIAEGMYGISREAQIPAMLDMLNVPYTGSDPLTLATCLDKSRTKEILSYYNINNAKFITVTSLSDTDNFNLKFPVIIKPVGEGSSKGIFDSSFIESMDKLKEAVFKNAGTYNQPSLIEEFLPGREFTVAIIGNGTDAVVLPIIEINFSELPENMSPIYSYEAKWIADSPEHPLEIFTCPADIDKSLEDKIKDIALKTYNILRCKDWSRIDIRLDSSGAPAIIEVNPLPGILPNPEDNSCFPKAARAYGLDYTQMLNEVLYASAKRYKLI
ncbi:MAG: D-alanine--D-alanine ligase [Ignavibacteria bacterium]